MLLYGVKTQAKNFTRHLLKKSHVLYNLFASIKGPLEEREVRRSLCFYRVEAAKRGLKVLEGKELKEALRRRLVQRGLNPVPKPKGALHIFVTFPNVMWESTFPKILAPFGRITVFDWRSLGYDDTSPNWLSHRDAMNRAMLEHFLKAHAEHPVDVVFGYLSGREIGPETLLAMATQGAVNMNICMDDKGGFPGPVEGGRYRSPAAIASAIDLNLTTTSESVVKYLVHGGLAMFFPLAADPQIHHPYNFPLEYDVTFVGGAHCWRPTFIARLRRMGIDVRTFGPGWEHAPVIGGELVTLYCRSRVNLGFSAVGNSRKIKYFKTRDFEIPMSGGLYLTQQNPELAPCYEIGKEILVYEDERDCVRKIKWVLSHPAEAQRIREAGRRRALRDHTWEKRFSDVFQLVGILNPMPPNR